MVHIFTVSGRNFRGFALCTVLLALCFCSSFAYAAGPSAGIAKSPQLDVSSLPPGIAKQIEKKGQADVLVVLDDSDARAFAAQQRKSLGLRYDNPAILAGKVRLLKQKKDTVLLRISQQDYKLIGNYDYFPVLFLSVNARALAGLQHMSEVKTISENRALTLFYTDSQNLINVPNAWTYLSPALPGAGTAVAVLDTGVNYSLSDFGTCTAPGSPGCSVAYEQCFGTQGTGGTPSCYSDNSHGTNVQGVILQVASDTKLFSLDVFSTDGYAYDSDILTALDWVVANHTADHIVSVNMSLGAGGYTSPCPNDPLAPAISTLRSAGVATAVASGNGALGSSISSPACAPDAISVGAVYANNYGPLAWSICTDATTAADQVTCFSDSSSFLTLLAPGSIITAAGITMSGTSQATPHVAGSVAVLKSQNSGLTVDEEVARLQATGVPILDSKSGVTTPRIDLYNAVSVTTPILIASPAGLDFTAPGAANPPSQTLKIINGGVGTLNWAVDNGGSTWLVPTPSSGTGSADVSVGIDTTGLSPGAYSGQLTITATGAVNSPATVPVTLNVPDPAYSDDFETGTLTRLPWVSGGNGSWFVQSNTVYGGSYAAQSPAMTNSQSSYLQVTLNVTTPGYVYFWLKTDTEPTYDNVKFWIDGTNQGLWTGWSGNTDWTAVRSQIEVSPGLHTFSWVYSKDSSVSVGSDAVWLDDVFFPPFNMASVSPLSYDFGEVALGGTSAVETFTVTDIGGANITLGSVSISGTNATEFAISADNCSGQTLTASGTCTVGVTFSPVTQADGKSASLLIPQAGSSAVTAASLSGTGGLKHQLTINKNTASTSGTGVVTSSPAGIDCGSLCSARFFDASTVGLTAVPDPGSFFSGWSGGGCSGSGSCSVTLSTDTTVSATFETIPPTANFSGSPLSGAAPLSVTFTDASSGNTTAWSWDFGDGGLSSLQNPVYTYTNPGTYSVSLTAANPGGSNTLTQPNYVSVTCPVSPNDVRIPRQTSLYFSTLQPAFDAVLMYGDTIEIHDGVTIVDTPALSGYQTVTLRGGYDPCFTTSSGYSTIQGSLTVANGTLTVDGIIIE